MIKSIRMIHNSFLKLREELLDLNLCDPRHERKQN